MIKWRRGKPNAPGLWLCYQNGEPVAATVEWCQPDSGRQYLRLIVDGDSWPLKDYPWALSPSFGPISEPKNR